MAKRMVEGHDASDEAHADGLLDTFGYEEGTLDEFDDSVEVPLCVILLCEDLGTYISAPEKKCENGVNVPAPPQRSTGTACRPCSSPSSA